MLKLVYACVTSVSGGRWGCRVVRGRASWGPAGPAPPPPAGQIRPWSADNEDLKCRRFYNIQRKSFLFKMKPLEMGGKKLVRNLDNTGYFSTKVKYWNKTTTFYIVFILIHLSHLTGMFSSGRTASPSRILSPSGPRSFTANKRNVRSRPADSGTTKSNVSS